MIELWLNGKLLGYYRIPNNFNNAHEYATYYNRNGKFFAGAYAIAI